MVPMQAKYLSRRVGSAREIEGGRAPSSFSQPGARNEVVFLAGETGEQTNKNVSQFHGRHNHLRHQLL